MLCISALLFVCLGQADKTVEVSLSGLGKGLSRAQLVERPVTGTADFTSFGKGTTAGQVLDAGKVIGKFQIFSGSLKGKGQDWVALLTDVPSGEKVMFQSEANKSVSPYSFSGDYTSSRKLSDVNGPILAVFCEPYDKSTPSRQDATFKTFTQVFDPEGEELVTKGLGGKFPHHRGLFYGFMKTTYAGGVVDTWHCKDGVHLNLTGPGVEEIGPIAARVTLPVGWYGKKDDLFANEERQFTAIRAGSALVIDFDSRVVPVSGKIKVDGDPQHAGFHFRASGEVADKTEKQTVYLRPSGKDRPGVTRNWPDRKDHINLPWNCMQFSANGQRYSVTYVNHASNTGESRFSEREYGRFGCYFVNEVTREKPLVVQYRVVVRRGDIDQAAAQADSDAFQKPKGEVQR